MMADGCLVVTSFAEVFVIIFLLVGGLDHFYFSIYWKYFSEGYLYHQPVKNVWDAMIEP